MQPFRVAEETFVLPQSLPVPGIGILAVNAMVIRGREPILVDTSAPVFRQEYLEAAFSLVDPLDVRWIFLSHDDRDHSGNLMPVLEACPNARLVTNAVGVGRMSDEWEIPMPRVHFLNDGETFTAGDRALTALRPPFFDSPATRGLWDSHTGVYYSVDSFGAVTAEEFADANDVPPDDYVEGFNWFNRINHPWHELTDPVKINAIVDRIRALDPQVIVSAHGPAAHRRSEEMCRMLSAIATMDPLPLPIQADLERMLAAGPIHQ